MTQKKSWIEDLDGFLNLQKTIRSRIIFPHIIDQFISFSGYKILDIGCGGGELSSLLAKNGADVLGVDSDECSITFAKEHYKNQDGLSFEVIHNKTNFSALNGSPFDAVIFCLVLSSINCDEDARQLLRNAQKSLKSDGTLYVIEVPPYFNDQSFTSVKFNRNYYYRDSGSYIVEMFDGEDSKHNTSGTIHHRSLTLLFSLIFDSDFYITNLEEGYDQDFLGSSPEVRARLNCNVPCYLIIKAKQKNSI